MAIKVYADQVVAAALAEVGYLEKASKDQLWDMKANPGNGNWQKFSEILCQAGFYGGANKNGFDWCAQFADACVLAAAGGNAKRAQELLCYTGPNGGQYGASCTWQVKYFRAEGRMIDRTGTPKPGDKIYFARNGSVCHTGIVVRVDAERVNTVEGNSGTGVWEHSYARTDLSIYGYGRPAYDGDTAPKPELPTKFLDVPKGKFYTDAVCWALEQGVTQGVDNTHFGPEETCTRGQVVTFLHRTYKANERRTEELLAQAEERFRQMLEEALKRT